jgi:hypothetical protein
MRKSLRFLPILLLLTGCIDDQKQQEARCEIDAVHQVSGDRAAFMRKCMEAAGYRWSWKHGTCLVGISTETNPYCYRPENWAGRVGFSIKIWFLRLGLLSS